MSAKTELIYFSKLCYKNKFVAATDGNLSVRTPRNSILMTATGISKGKVTNADIVKSDISGKVVKGKKKLSSEFRLHSFIYQSRIDISAVIHTHPVYATAFASAGISLDKPVLPEVYLKMGSIPLAKYATPSTEEVAESISKYVMSHNVILLANHGLVAYAKTLQEAYWLTEKAEQFARIMFYAKLLGGEKVLTKAQLSKLKELKIY